jgi:DNA integrity scanning protein DisA with diadenylate cyclase activity
LTKGRAIARAFGTIGKMAEARETDWTRVAGIGKKLAVKFVRGLRTGNWR